MQQRTTGIKVFESDSPKDADEKVWGHVSFFDQISERHRIITMIAPPDLGEKEIVCLSDTGDIFHFSFVTKQLWDENVSQIVNTPKEFENLLSDTEKVQEYLRGL